MIPPFPLLPSDEPLPLAHLAQGPPPDASGGLSATMEKVRKGLRGPGARAAAVEIAGEGEVFGFPSRFTLGVAADGRFRRRIESRVFVEEGFDGKRAWTVDDAGLARELVLQDGEFARFDVGVACGTWADPDGPFLATAADEAPGEGPVALSLRLREGTLVGRLEIDRATWLPTRLSVSTFGGEWRWTFDGFREERGWVLPARIVRQGPGGVEFRFVASSLAPAEAGERSFAMPASRPSRASFDPSVPAAIETRRSPTGLLLVHPRVGGRDLGWFILDTGAAIEVISKPAADAAGMPSLGRTFTAGAGAAVTPTVLREGGRLDLGPFSLERVLYTEMDLSPFEAELGLSVAGILGYGVLARSVVAVDLAAPRVEIHDPERFAEEGLEWRDLLLYGGHPHVRAKFEGNEGLFRIDTGAGEVHVFFHAPTVARSKLLEGRTLRSAQAAGAGGIFDIRLGTVSSFELGGRAFGETSAFFALPGSGTLDDPFTEGTIGAPLLAHFRTVFDYRRARVAFAPEPGTGNP
ncbi:MAG: aspartyl protease family protein [Planctomycetes bacterium]|nr:aspartyl protease family protein [Planctomycetota bacterium]